VDVLKFNASSVESLGEDSTNTTIVETVISLAHSLDLEACSHLIHRSAWKVKSKRVSEKRFGAVR